jgi:hypothetical protein
MPKRFAAIWFRNLLTDQKAIRQPDLKGKAFVFAEPDHGPLQSVWGNRRHDALQIFSY